MLKYSIFQMRGFQLYMLTLSLCTGTYGEEEFNWKGCGLVGLPAGSDIDCTIANGCTITCTNGQGFSNGASYLNVWCSLGQWKYIWSTNIPQCKASTVVCIPSCENGGICESPGVCRCPEGFRGLHCGFYSCDITSVFDGSHRCYYNINSQYTCDIHCSREDEEVSHTCSQATGIWSPVISKCKPDNSKCVIDPVGFDWGYSCTFRNIGLSCNVWCSKEEEGDTYICDHSTGIWSPPLTKCTPDLEKCLSKIDAYDGGSSCRYRNSQYICDLYCTKGEDTITHACSPSTGVFSPPITQCRPDNSKCDIRAVFNGGASCHYTNIGYKCNIYCSNMEDAVTHICSHNTGLWSPPITKCQISKEFNWNGCGRKGLPEASRTECRTASGCEVTCKTGYQFSNGAEHINLECQDGHWTYLGNNFENLLGRPHCQPVCSPACRNGGKCLRPGLCQCTREFTGLLCQYRFSNCDLKSSDYNGSADCKGNREHLRCDLWCSNKKLAATHTCTYSTGRWSPPIRKCIW